MLPSDIESPSGLTRIISGAARRDAPVIVLGMLNNARRTLPGLLSPTQTHLEAKKRGAGLDRPDKRSQRAAVVARAERFDIRGPAARLQRLP